MIYKKTKGDYILDTFNYALLTALFLITFYPFWYVFVVSLNDPTDTIKGGLTLFPRILTFSSYGVIWRDKEFMSSINVTLARTLIGTPVTLLCTSMLAYVFTKKDLIGYSYFKKAFVFTMYFGGGLIPFYMVLKSINLIDNFLVYIIPSAIGVYYMILISAFMNELPKELEESATLDGANELYIFFKIIIPLSKPILATIALFVAINHWNSFFDAYLFTSKQSLKPLQVVIMNILNNYQTSSMMNSSSAIVNITQKNSITPDSIRMAATIVSTVPIILAYPFVQKYFVKGMMIGAVKA